MTWLPWLSLLLSPTSALAEERLTILHTNDWQSRLLGYGPNAAYTPTSTGDDPTVGGIARLSTLIAQRRAAADGPVLLLLDAAEKLGQAALVSFADPTTVARYLGELVLERGAAGLRVVSYDLHPVDDSILGDPALIARIEDLKRQVDDRVLSAHGYAFDQVLADADSDRLYSITATTDVGGFLPLISETSFGLLDVELRDETGAPVRDVSKLLIDADPHTPGVQEKKAWRALLDHAAAQPDLDGDGVPDISATGPLGGPRVTVRNSLSPTSLLRHSTWKMKTAAALPLSLIVALLGGVLWRWRRSD